MNITVYVQLHLSPTRRPAPGTHEHTHTHPRFLCEREGGRKEGREGEGGREGERGRESARACERERARARAEGGGGRGRCDIKFKGV